MVLPVAMCSALTQRTVVRRSRFAQPEPEPDQPDENLAGGKTAAQRKAEKNRKKREQKKRAKLAAKGPTAPATAEALQWHSLHQWTPKKKVGSAPSDQESSKARPGSPSARPAEPPMRAMPRPAGYSWARMVAL